MSFHNCKIKITVVKKELYRDVAEEFLKQPEQMKRCDLVDENREYIATSPYFPPEGFCPSAWADIRPYLILAAADGDTGMMKESGVGVAICADPFRPVVFRIERVE